MTKPDKIGRIEQVKNTIICGEALEVLKRLPDCCVNTVITSPPYY